MAEQLVLAGDPPIEIHLRQSAQARRLTLRVSSRDGRVVMTVPRGTRRRIAEEFAASKRDWISRHIAKIGDRAPIAFGGVIPLEGRNVSLTLGTGRAPHCEGDRLFLPKRAYDAPGRYVAGYLKAIARDRLSAASDHFAAQVGRPYSKITLRDTRSRWGSCSSAGSLNYSWRLAMAPPEVLRYVAAHEVAHLVQMDHSPAFWSIVASLDPKYRDHVAWLRTHGAGLQAINLD